MLGLQVRPGLTYLFISDDTAVVERISHRVAVMYLSEIVELGPRHTIFENAQHSHARRLLAAVPIADPPRRSQKRPISQPTKSKVQYRRLTAFLRGSQYREVSPGHIVMVEHPGS